ncbi:Uncharacterised protein [Prevotella disiens]|uniref:Uncharacterized protein n=1 Tax=Prevotella disiens TaxID=28130 RepID=A0A379DXA5_9BACT|nr:Uncharacterised protein [Prevotella disiens]
MKMMKKLASNKIIPYFVKALEMYNIGRINCPS